MLSDLRLRLSGACGDGTTTVVYVLRVLFNIGRLYLSIDIYIYSRGREEESVRTVRTASPCTGWPCGALELYQGIWKERGMMR